MDVGVNVLRSNCCSIGGAVVVGCCGCGCGGCCCCCCWGNCCCCCWGDCPCGRGEFDVRSPLTTGARAVSLQSWQFFMTAETVSLILTQWYLSAIIAVVLLIPPWFNPWIRFAISYCSWPSLITSLSFSSSLLPSSL